MNCVQLSGVIKKLTVSEPKDSSKKASAIILLAYGREREMTGGSVEFVNAVQIRVPSYKFPLLRDKLRQGQFVDVIGKVQGVFKSFADQGVFTVELVAERIDIQHHIALVQPKARMAEQGGSAAHGIGQESGAAESAQEEAGAPAEGAPAAA
ncbi:MAG: hypothetical protein RB191_05595 [Terriglobia bacterium]|nr:hypothetical protein [Terriglobia bacterium]